jgi:CheY-like chemotaxis protein
MPKTPPGHLLLVDDEPLVRSMLAEVLTTFGYVVEQAESGEVAMKHFSPDRYQVVITDLVMPRMTGLELARRIREVDRSVPIILLTGSARTAEIDEAHRSGLRVLHKPLSITALAEALEAASRPA